MLTRRPAALAVLAAALGPASAAAEARDVIVPSSVERTVRLGADDERALALACPGTGVALNAAVTRASGDVSVRESRPGSAPQGWSMSLSAGDGGRATAVLRCVSLVLPAGSEAVDLRERSQLPPARTIAAGATRRVVVDCPAGYLATGYGVAGGLRGDVRVAAALPRATGWALRLHNAGDRTARAAVRTRCLSATARGRIDGRPASLAFRIARRAAGEGAGPGSAFTRRCRPGEFSVATGSTPAGAGGLTPAAGGAFGERGARWSFAGPGGPQRVTTHLLCMDLSSRFG